MPISYIFSGQPMVGTEEDDFVIGYSGTTGTHANTVNAAGGDDWVVADSSSVFIPAETFSNGTIATAQDIDGVAQWTTGENPQFGDAGIPHMTAIVEATIGQSEMFKITIGAGQTITIDIDYGHGSPIGVPRDLVVEMRDAANVVLASDDESLVTDGGLGSFPTTPSGTSTHDPYLTFTAPAAGTYYINVRPFGGGQTATFTGNDTFVMNVSVTGHATTADAVMGADIVDGGDGADSLFGVGGNDIINGGLGDDLIDGGSGFDTINGGDGVDTIYGGDGTEETVHGDGGDDILYSGGEGHYFGDAGDDLIHAGISGAVAEVLNGGTGVDTLDTRSWNGGYEIDLTSGATNFGETFLLFENLTTGDGADSIIGNGADNVFRTNGGNDTVYGLNGADVFWAGEGIDAFHGGGGIDAVDYSEAAAGMRAQLNTNASTNDGDGGTDTFSGIENLTGSSFDDILIGDGGLNVLRGGGGMDTLLGLGGNDVLWGGPGALNTLQGGLGNDRYVLEAGDSVIEFAGEGTDTVEARINTYVLANHAENLVFGGTGDFAGTGNAAANVVTGGAGQDVLRGRGGVDVLIGGAGNDIADYTLAASGVTARLDQQRATNDGDGASDTFASIEHLIGSNFNDTLIGNGADNFIQGGVGVDLLLGFNGDDVLMGGSLGNNQLQGGAGNDWYVLDAFDTCVEFAGEGIDTVQAGVNSYTLGAHIENLLYTGPGKFVGNGNALDNEITGGLLNDILRGKGGNDTIDGGGGTDEVQLRGLQADYTITVEGISWRVVDNVAGRDGSTLVTSVELLRFANGATQELLTVFAPPEPVDKHVGAWTLPPLGDDAFLLSAMPDGKPSPGEPLVLSDEADVLFSFEAPLIGADMATPDLVAHLAIEPAWRDTGWLE